MPLKLNSSGGGSVTLDVPSTGSTFTATFPAATGNVVTTGSTAAVTPAMLTQPLTLATAQNSTSGTSIDFTGIPSWVRRITVMFNEVSTNGSSAILVQMGAGSIQTTSYVSTGINTNNQAAPTNAGSNSTAGHIIFSTNAVNLLSGHIIMTLISGNTWISSHIGKIATTNVVLGGGSVALSGTLDRIRITTVNGTDAFDAGSINIMYEG